MRHKIITLGLLSGVFFISGCSFIAERTELAPKPVYSSPSQLIATDFVNALSQLHETQASTTTIELNRANRADRFTQAMGEALQKAGYGTRWVDRGFSAMLFDYRRIEEASAASTRRDTFELAVGAVELRRSYITDSRQRVRPVSALFVRGADARGIVLNDELFERADHSGNKDAISSEQTYRDGPAHLSAVPFKPTAPTTRIPAIQAVSRQSPTQKLQGTSVLHVPADANPLDPTINGAKPGHSLSLPLSGSTKEENVFDLGGSKFNDLLSGHVPVAEKVSMGPTKVRGGNAALALGRAGRVVEALRFAGVADGRILDEGCWAGDGALDALPRRGVVLTLNRQM